MNIKKYLLLFLCLPCFMQAKTITISRLTCEMQEGLVVVEGSPRLGWVMESPENGTRQSAYEIDIREAFTGRSVWNSGKVRGYLRDYEYELSVCTQLDASRIDKIA